MNRHKEFDTSVHVKSLRELPEEIRNLPRKERSAFRKKCIEASKERIETFRLLVAKQQEGVAFIIRDLQRLIAASPQASTEELMGTVAKSADVIHLPERQRALFREAIITFAERRERVEQLYEKHHDNPVRLFGEIFEFTPQGEVTLEKSSYMLYFVAHNEEDYVRAMMYQRPDIPVDQDTHIDTRDDALRSGGFAATDSTRSKHSMVPLPYSGIVAVERGTKKTSRQELWPIAHRETIELPAYENMPTLFSIVEVKKLVIQPSGHRDTITITMTDTPPTNPAMLGKIITIMEGDNPIFQGRLVRKDQNGYLYQDPMSHQELEKLEDDMMFPSVRWIDEKFFEKTGKTKIFSDKSLRLPQIPGNTSDIIVVSIAASVLGLSNQSAQALTAHLERHEWISGIPQTPKVSTIKAHEEQHIINKLYEPIERGCDPLIDIVKQVSAEREHATPTRAELRSTILVRFMQGQRRILGVDSDIRDEILAQLRDGSSIKTILHTLSHSPLYNVTDRLFGGKIARLPEVFSQTLKEAIEQAGDTPEGHRLQKLFTLLSATQIEKAIQAVFVKAYKRDLHVWMQAITDLKAKGYRENNLLSLLYTAPISQWRQLAKRMPEIVK